MNELNKKLAEWVGLCWHEYEGLVGTCKKCGMVVGCIYSGDDEEDARIHPPDFTESLDACEKWLIPKLDLQQIIFQPDHYCGITANDELYEAQAETLALALCLAIEKIIEVKND